MNIQFLANTLEPGGAERQLVTLASALKAAGHDVQVVVFLDGGALEEECGSAGVEVFRLGTRGRWDVARPLWRFVHEARRRRPDIVHGYLVVPDLMATLCKPWLRGARVVWGVRHGGIDLDRFGFHLRWAERLAPRLARWADLVIANSHAGARFHIELGYPADRIVVVQNGIDTARFRPEPDGGRAARAAWGVPEGVPLVGMVARLDPIKDHAGFVAAMAEVARRAPGAWFVCVGAASTADREHLTGLARSAGLAPRFVAIGRWDDLAAAYSALDVMCLVSVAEGFPNVVAEAMACGTACVVSDVGDAAEIVDELGTAVPAGSVAGIADAVVALLERAHDPGRAEARRRRIVERYPVDQLTERTLVALGGISVARR